ncbi:hypothetical protein [Marinibactrum halimedae]|uniref:Uncharacterized protein n=1 Tax=Marinibactrum halimedae TaxID=1444977 RepID=A0AA37T4T6_9GAMM|nr:hypothetical protein [Marinibactrum halimedae]MCD9458200.1 hypothetical protein [Marinibactrum halimedae]GLS27173.1 hypothetical protein GCM10007877_28920 [Marinibactrum halimedae]
MFSQKSAGKKLVAGHHGGKHVYMSDEYRGIYEALVIKARQNNYWAVVAVNGLNSLTTGTIDKNNLFVSKATYQNGGHEEYEMILPGITATTEKRPDDTFYITALTASLDYDELHAQNKKPGIHEAYWDGRQWIVRSKKSGEVTNEKGRLVAIADTDYSNSMELNDIAEAVYDQVSEMPGTTGDQLKRDGFDIHLTPRQGKTLRGNISLKEARHPLNITDTIESSMALAKTMYNSRKIPSVTWCSERHGSIVLTQAMKALADTGFKLGKDSGNASQSFFMVWPYSNPDVGVEQAFRIKMDVDRKYKKAHVLSYVGNMDELKSINRRLEERKNGHSYSKLKAWMDRYTLYKTGYGAASLLVGGTTIATVGAMAGATVTAIAPAVGTFLAIAVPVIVAQEKALKTADSLVQFISPGFHKKHIGNKK